MKQRYKVIEVTKENEGDYISDIVQLEELVLKRMEEEGRVGQLFTTGREGIHEYVDSRNNHVMIALGEQEGKQCPISASYITQGQIDFTYNDVTKYFKCGEDYLEYVKSKYTPEQFEKMIRTVYIEKICAFKYARDVVLQEQGVVGISYIKEQEKNEVLLRLIEQEYNNPQNRFHEKSEIRENLNKYMSLYMKHVKKDSEGYQYFYWVDFEYLKKNLQSDGKGKGVKTTQFDSTMEAYDKILKYQRYMIYDRTHCPNISQYFEANTENTVELDTYITHPESRENGIARILVFEGIKKSLHRLLKEETSEGFFLVSTLHDENLSSKYVSEFFGLKDYLFVNRRSGRDRQVHIFGMKRENVISYLDGMEKKIAVLYNYNPHNIQISNEERIQILNEQMNYELNELQRLENVKSSDEKKKYKGYIKGKKSKIELLREMIKRIELEKVKTVNKNTAPSGAGAGADGDISLNYGDDCTEHQEL